MIGKSSSWIGLGCRCWAGLGGGGFLWRGFAVGLVEQGGKMVAQGATISGSRVVCIAGNLAAKTGRDFEGFAGVGEAHLVRVAGIHVFEVPLGGIEEGFGQGVLAVAE